MAVQTIDIKTDRQMFSINPETVRMEDHYSFRNSVVAADDRFGRHYRKLCLVKVGEGPASFNWQTLSVPENEGLKRVVRGGKELTVVENISRAEGAIRSLIGRGDIVLGVGAFFDRGEIKFDFVHLSAYVPFETGHIVVPRAILQKK